jgi:hypothetical protein
MLFTTRDLLAYGTRAAVDQTLYRLVKQRFIKRLARGVFCLYDEQKSTPPPSEVAAVKAAAFGKQIFIYGADAATLLGIPVRASRPNTFFVNGSTSSFRYGKVVVYFKSSCPRRVSRQETQTGLVIKTLLHFGRNRCDQKLFSLITAQLGRTEKEELRRFADLVPAWLSDIFNRQFRLPKRWTTSSWDTVGPTKLQTNLT